MTPKKGSLYIVAVPIGNYQDITLRALDILKQVDGVICEEFRQGSTLLKKLGLTNQLVTLNEHNEEIESTSILTRLLTGQSLALISDCGTPVFADPGHALIELVASAGVPVIPVPGPSSLMAALSICDFKIDQFVYGGFLPRIEVQRRQDLTRLRASGLPIVLLDTPYRLTTLLEDVSKVFGSGVRVTLACDLTLPGERIYRGTVEQVLKMTNGKKSEFVLIIQTGGRGPV
jgi:16S rRNA (cytidine1402-2'-O)-methyltransferase